jgi:3-oxoacyl-[acyl-carrier protein] reductase
MNNNKNRVAIVTGAGQGIGRALAISLAADGAIVFVNDISADKAEQVTSEIRKNGGLAFPQVVDVSVSKDVTRMVSEIAEQHGHIDILVNCARPEPPRPKTFSLEEWWDRIFAVILKGAYLCSLACFDIMEKDKFGRIINISSIQAYLGKPDEDWIAYSSAKSGMHGLTRSFAQKGMPFGITTNIVTPDYIETEVMEKRWGKEKMADYARTVPIGRAGRTEDVTKAVLFLIDSDFITGETIFVNGGRFVMQ